MAKRVQSSWLKQKWAERQKTQGALCRASYLNILSSMSEELVQAFVRGHKVLACGNGGSACDATHFCEELTGRYGPDRPALPALPLTEGAHITCTANDYGFEHVFARAVQALGQTGDILLVLSTSGNSPNIIKAVESAQKIGMLVLAFTGKGGGKVKDLCDLEFRVPSQKTEIIQEMHIQALHSLIEGVERLMYPQLYGPVKRSIKKKRV